MIKQSGNIRERRAVDGKLRSHLEWPYTVAIAYNIIVLNAPFFTRDKDI